MPRRKPPRKPSTRPLSEVLGGGTSSASYAGQVWTVRSLRGNSSGKSYTCPGCQQQVSAAQAHVVVWPAEGLGDVTDRRHWHTPCWQARDRRPPRGSWR